MRKKRGEVTVGGETSLLQVEVTVLIRRKRKGSDLSLKETER